MAEYCGKCHRGVRDYRDGRGWIHVADQTPEKDCFIRARLRSSKRRSEGAEEVVDNGDV